MTYVTNRHSARAYRLKVKYGITVEQYDRMLKMQRGKCAICSRVPAKLRLSVDHDHKTGRVRGLLCWTCNKYRVGMNTAATAPVVAAYIASDFDGRVL